MSPTAKTLVELQYRDSLFRAGIAAILASQVDIVLRARQRFDVAPERPCLDGPQAPDVIVADYESGIEAAGILRSGRAGHAKVLVVTERETEAEIRHSIRSGVHGYLLSSCSADELVDGVRGVRRGMRPMSDAATHRLAGILLHPALTAREQAVLQLLARGLPNKSIATQLNIAVGTVKSFTRSILAKLSAASRTEAVALAERRGLLRPLGANTAESPQVAGEDEPSPLGSFWASRQHIA